jgi:polyferredoxin
MTTHEPTMNIAVSSMMGTLVVRSITLAALVSLVILALAALLSPM